ncbi:MAG: ArnT family glycosyltransferase [Methylotenera sp.]
MKPINLKNIELKKNHFFKFYYLYLLFGLTLILRVMFAYTQRIENDEPQHLHVVWGWANGLLQYRDLFDNHTPLFHMMFSPIYTIFGERTDIVVMMRLTVIPLFFLALWAIYLIGKALYSKQVGIWAAIITGLSARFFIVSLEFRADDLWMLFWLMALAVLVNKPLKTSRILVVGLLLGAALSTSMKTTLLLSALGLATLGAHLIIRAPAQPLFKTYLSNALVLLAGLVFIPAVLILFFASKGALGSMYYSVIQHNIVSGMGQPRSFGTILSILLLTIGGIYLIRKSSIGASLLQLRLIIFLTYGLSMLGLYSFWPLITAQDFLPLTPLLIISAAGFFIENFAVRQNLAKSSAYRWAKVIPIMIVTLELGYLVTNKHLWHDGTLKESRLLAEVLQLTRSDETIMDLKGETIFRKRGFFYVFEGVTRKRIELGLINDTIPENIVREKTYVAVPDSVNFPPRGRAFLNQNFLLVGDLRVAGKLLPAVSKTTGNDITFDINIPTSYVLASDQAVVSGLLDGTIYNGARQLNAGSHTFRPSMPEGSQLAIVWAPAIQRGFSPFTLKHSS